MTQPNANVLQIYVTAAGNPPAEPDPRIIVEHFKQRLAKKLTKKGRQVQWIEGPAPIIIGLHIDPGNRMLRYLIPFISPAVVEVKGKWDIAHLHTEQLYARGAAHFGLLGGSPVGMCKVAAQVAADRVAKRLLQVKITGFEPVMKP